MARDWVKMHTDLYRSPKVCALADRLLDPSSEIAKHVSQNCQRDMTVTRNVMRNAVVGALVSVWGVMRHRGKRDSNANLVCPGVTVSVLDDIADIDGFGAAMQSIGWVTQTDNGIVFPEFFDENNVDPAATKNAERQRRFRERYRNVTAGVTGNVMRNVTSALHRNVTSRKRRVFNPPTPLAQSRGNGQDHAPVQRPPRTCAYCQTPTASTGSVNGYEHCFEHRHLALQSIPPGRAPAGEAPQIRNAYPNAETQTGTPPTTTTTPQPADPDY